MRSILALDVSKSACGYAFGIPGDRPISGVATFGKASHTDDETWRNAMVWLNEQMTFHRPDIVAIEAAIMSSAPGQGGFTNPQSQALLLGLQAVLRTVVKARLSGAAHLVAASSARKTFTGRGTYGKGEAKHAVQAEAVRRGWLTVETMDPDRADALAVWCHEAAQQLPEVAFHQPKGRRAAA
jgi:Holliday junction resolvasome RuvABC endonuclease subunit